LSPSVPIHSLATGPWNRSLYIYEHNSAYATSSKSTQTTEQQVWSKSLADRKQNYGRIKILPFTINIKLAQA